jgi:hypothetical protein
MTLLQQVNQMSAKIAVALYMSVYAMSLTVCMAMKTNEPFIWKDCDKENHDGCFMLVYVNTDTKIRDCED